MAGKTHGKDDLDLRAAAIRGQVLGVTVLRGYAKLSDLAKISKPDIYDQKTNPTGTQRDLNPKHAREAYEYVRTHELGFWPEVFLCVRDSRVLKFTPFDNCPDFGTLEIHLNRATDPDHIAISRVDGNHRLHYADGETSGFPAIDKEVSFCLADGLTLEQEITLFRDINANQKAMNTSHLDNIEARLTPEDKLKREQPHLYIARRLGRDPESVLHNMVYEGGRKAPGSPIALRGLSTGITYMFSKPTKLTALKDADAQYRVIRNFFAAVKKWQPQAWEEANKYIILRGAGLWGICFIGADVIDRALSQGMYKTQDLYSILKSGKEWDWSNKGDFQGLSGRGGAVKISDSVTSEIKEEGGISVRILYSKIMQGG